MRKRFAREAIEQYAEVVSYQEDLYKEDASFS